MEADGAMSATDEALAVEFSILLKDHLIAVILTQSHSASVEAASILSLFNSASGK